MEFLDYFDQLVADDPEAFKIFEEQYREFILATIRMHLISKKETRDCYHGLLLTIRSRLKEYDRIRPIKAFLGTIARNFARQHTRRIAFENKTFIKAYHGKLEKDTDTIANDPMMGKRIELLKAIVHDNINDNDIWAAVLKYRDDLGYMTIAGILTCKVDYARTHANRGLLKLYNIANDLYPEYFRGYKYE